MSVEKMREDFESWFSSKFDVNRERLASGRTVDNFGVSGYVLDDGTQTSIASVAFMAWQASRSYSHPTFPIGSRVSKIKGSRWQGRVVGTYSTELTPEGYAVESETEHGSVQIYPAHALELVSDK